MDNRTLRTYRCGCEKCLADSYHTVTHLHKNINLLMSRLNEQQRRWFAALLAEQIGLRNGGVRHISKICGISEKTVRRGLKELETNFAHIHTNRIRSPGAGRHSKKHQ